MRDRDLIEVLDRVLEVIPESEGELRNGLQKVRSSAGYTAPEAIASRWIEAADVFAEHLPADTNVMSDWQARVAELWLDTPIEKLLEADRERAKRSADGPEDDNV